MAKLYLDSEDQEVKSLSEFSNYSCFESGGMYGTHKRSTNVCVFVSI